METPTAFSIMIVQQLKEKYGDDWHKHIYEYSDDIRNLKFVTYIRILGEE